MKPAKEYIEAPCKYCKQPIGNDTRTPDGKYHDSYNDSSGWSHKKCFKKHAMRKI